MITIWPLSSDISKPSRRYSAAKSLQSRSGALSCCRVRLAATSCGPSGIGLLLSQTLTRCIGTPSSTCPLRSSQSLPYSGDSVGAGTRKAATRSEIESASRRLLVRTATRSLTGSGTSVSASCSAIAAILWANEVLAGSPGRTSAMASSSDDVSGISSMSSCADVTCTEVGATILC